MPCWASYAWLAAAVLSSSWSESSSYIPHGFRLFSDCRASTLGAAAGECVILGMSGRMSWDGFAGDVGEAVAVASVSVAAPAGTSVGTDSVVWLAGICSVCAGVGSVFWLFVHATWGGAPMSTSTSTWVVPVVGPVGVDPVGCSCTSVAGLAS